MNDTNHHWKINANENFEGALKTKSTNTNTNTTVWKSLRRNVDNFFLLKKFAVTLFTKKLIFLLGYFSATE